MGFVSTKLLLSNKNKNAFIAVHCIRSQSEFDYRQKEFLRSALTKEFMRTEKEFLRSGAVTWFAYNVSHQGRYRGETIGWFVEMDFETPIQRNRLIARGTAYPIGDDTHLIEIELYSDRLTFSENLEVFEKLYKSIKWGEYLTKPTAE